MLADRVHDHPGLEPVVDHQRARHEQRDPDVADQGGDVEQRRDPEDGVPGGELHPVPVGLGVERHGGVGAHRALWHAGGPGGVAQHRHVGGIRLGRLGLAAAVRAEDLLEVQRPLRVPPLRPAEQPLVVAGLPVERGAGDHGRDRGLTGADDLFGDRLVQVVQAQQRAGAGVGEQVGQLAVLVHRADDDGRSAGLPRRQQRDDERRVVLQVDPEPVPGAEPVVGQGRRERA